MERLVYQSSFSIYRSLSQASSVKMIRANSAAVSRETFNLNENLNAEKSHREKGNREHSQKRVIKKNHREDSQRRRSATKFHNGENRNWAYKCKRKWIRNENWRLPIAD